MTAAALLLGAPLLLAAAGPPPAVGQAPTHRIHVDVQSAMAVVEVTRTLTAEGHRAGPSGERLLDVALPEGAALIDVQVMAGSNASKKRAWRTVEPVEAARARDEYTARFTTRGFAAAREPFDDATDVRIRIAPTTTDAGAPVDVRYRFSVLPALANGRRHLRFPPSLDKTPTPIDVEVGGWGTSAIEIAGSSAAKARVPGRSAWEISWAKADASAEGPSGSTSHSGFSPTYSAAQVGKETLFAVAVEAALAPDAGPPTQVLFLIDRSRSVGPAGAAAERDLARKLMEALPPSTRFDALLFDQGSKRLFPASRTATREALGALEAELVPDRLRNGTDLPAALREARAWLLREAPTTGARPLVAILTDGALPETSAAALDEAFEGAFGGAPGVRVAAWIVRPIDDEPAPPWVVHALRGFTARRSGLVREVRANELDEIVPASLAALARGGDVTDVRLELGDKTSRPLVEALAPGEGRTLAFSLGHTPPPHVFRAVLRGAPTRIVVRSNVWRVEPSWLEPLVRAGPSTRFLSTDALAVLVESVEHAAPVVEVPVKGTLDREVVRNTLALAYLPRARACYLSRTGGTAVERDLTGRVRLAIELARGEVGRAVVESTTLAAPRVEACLRDAALALDVPRALRNDFPATAVLNLVFRPYTPEKPASPEEAALGAKIDLVIEELHRTQPKPRTNDEPPNADRSMVPTR